jgi:hypothetical protein
LFVAGVIVAGSPAVVVTVNVTGASEPTVAVTVFVPTTGPNVQEPAVASPFASVVAVDAPIVPPPLTANVTTAPRTGALDADFTITVGAALAVLTTFAVGLTVVTAVILAGVGVSVIGPVPESPPPHPKSAIEAAANRNGIRARMRANVGPGVIIITMAVFNG